MPHTVVLVWLAAITGALMVGSSATAFAAINSVDPYMKSAWRTEITSICFIFPMLYFYKSSSYKSFLKANLFRTFLSGSLMGAHYCLWVLSLDLTSVAHSLLFVCSTPLLMIIYFFATKKPVKKSEILGVLVSLAGMIVICVEKNSPEGATVLGDIVALIGAAAIGMSFIVSEDLVAKGGVGYLCVMNAFAALFCIFVSLVNHLINEGAEGFAAIGEVVQWCYTEQGLYAVYLGVFVGFIGNGCLYFVLKQTSPLIVVVILFFEPPLGSLVAWIFGFQKEPSVFTWVGGFIILIGNFIVAVFAKLKNEQTASKVQDEEVKDEENVESLDKSLIN